LIALFGGIPGIIGAWDYFKRSSIRIEFDPDQSVACRITSKTPFFSGKSAILLYHMTITGKGLQPAYLRAVRLALKTDGKWINGRQFAPSQKDETDKEGVTMKAVHLRVEKPNDHDDIFVLGWENFREGQKLAYGEPAHFSYAAYFDIDENEFGRCQRLRIVVTDYLGNDFSATVDCSRFTNKYSNLFLMQDR
jgi:hypothetical protein